VNKASFSNYDIRNLDMK